MPEIPQSEIAATNFVRWARNREKLGEILGRFRTLVAVQNYAKKFSQNSPQFITPYPANEMSKFHLRELLGLGGAKKLSKKEP